GLGGERRVRAVHEELLDQIDVFAVGVNSYAWGPAAKERFPNGKVTGLLEQFLRLDSPGAVVLSVPGIFARLLVPTLRDGRVAFEGGQAVYKRQAVIEVGAGLPIEAVDGAGMRRLCRAPGGRSRGSRDPD